MFIVWAVFIKIDWYNVINDSLMHVCIVTTKDLFDFDNVLYICREVILWKVLPEGDAYANVLVLFNF